MKVVVTGATGIIGRVCVQRLAECGHQVVALSRYAPRPGDHRVAIADFRVTDFSFDDLCSALKGSDGVVHLAAMRPTAAADAMGFKAYFEANVEPTETLLRAAVRQDVTRFVLASSISVYSRHCALPYREDQYPIPRNLYGASKLACENLLSLFSGQTRLGGVALRIAQVICNDVRQPDAMLMRFMALARRKQALPLWGAGAGARDLVYVEDVVSACQTALAFDSPCGVFNIGCNRAHSNLEIAAAINRAFENEGNVALDLSRQEDGQIIYMDSGRAMALLGWKPKWSLQDAFDDMRRKFDLAVPGNTGTSRGGGDLAN